MSIRKEYVKPEIETIPIEQGIHLLAGSVSNDTGIDENLHEEYVQKEQLAKPSGPFRRSIWDD
jgi:hypothetical protein